MLPEKNLVSNQFEYKEFDGDTTFPEIKDWYKSNSEEFIDIEPAFKADPNFPLTYEVEFSVGEYLPVASFPLPFNFQYANKLSVIAILLFPYDL